MVIIATFDLKAHQYETVNALTNSILDKIVYYNCPEGFEQTGHVAALYELCHPYFGFREFSKTLQELRLTDVSGKPCLYMNVWLVMFFYVDDIILPPCAE